MTEVDAAASHFGPYDLLALLAKAERAESWLARQSGAAGSEKLVVVKRLPQRLESEPEYVDRFLDEARIASHLSHGNILSVYELGQVDGRHFLSMEYLAGLPLGMLLQRSIERLSDLPIAIAANLMLQAAAGVHYAHEAKDGDGAPLHVVHRELSPLNLLVGWDGTLKIADLGMAIADGRRAHTRTGVVRGAPKYMAPEQVLGKPIDRRADVFGLGILLWELLTGRRLFKRDTPEATYDAIVGGRVLPPSTHRLELSTELDALVLRALAVRPEDRFATAADFGRALAQLLRKEGLDVGLMGTRRFLEQHFATDRAEHETFLARVTAAPVLAEPVFAHSLHGLDVAAYTDGDTDRDSVAPTHAEEAPPAPVLARTPSTARRGLRVVLFLLVLVALGAAVFVGIVLGRAHRPPAAAHTPVGAAASKTPFVSSS